MANWIKQVSSRVRISDKGVAEITTDDKRKVFFNVDNLGEVLKFAGELKAYLESPEGQSFHTDAANSREAQEAQEYLDKQMRVQAQKEIKMLQSQKETLQRKFGAASKTLCDDIDKTIASMMLKAI